MACCCAISSKKAQLPPTGKWLQNVRVHMAKKGGGVQISVRQERNKPGASVVLSPGPPPRMESHQRRATGLLIRSEYLN